jgi:hypothetical protein
MRSAQSLMEAVCLVLLSQKVVIFIFALRKRNFRFCVFENRMQKRIFESKWGEETGEETGDCRKLHSEKLRNL